MKMGLEVLSVIEWVTVCFVKYSCETLLACTRSNKFKVKINKLIKL
jgi:hypothetical protein